MKVSFLERCYRNKARPEEIDEAIENWKIFGVGELLYEYLGMTEEQYSRFQANRNCLKQIIREYREGKKKSRS